MFSPFFFPSSAFRWPEPPRRRNGAALRRRMSICAPGRAPAIPWSMSCRKVCGCLSTVAVAPGALSTIAASKGLYRVVIWSRRACAITLREMRFISILTMMTRPLTANAAPVATIVASYGMSGGCVRIAGFAASADRKTISLSSASHAAGARCAESADVALTADLTVATALKLVHHPLHLPQATGQILKTATGMPMKRRAASAPGTETVTNGRRSLSGARTIAGLVGVHPAMVKAPASFSARRV